MEFEWDENKNLSNIEKHGISFYDALEVFRDSYFVFPSNRQSEQRIVAVGKTRGRIIAIVYTIRAGVYQIISAKAARKNEKQQYEQNSKNKY